MFTGSPAEGMQIRSEQEVVPLAEGTWLGASCSVLQVLFCCRALVLTVSVLCPAVLLSCRRFVL